MPSAPDQGRRPHADARQVAVRELDLDANQRYGETAGANAKLGDVGLMRRYAEDEALGPVVGAGRAEHLER
jgi:hypothetical protein